MLSTISPFFQLAAILFSILLIFQILLREDRQRFSNKLLLSFLILSSYSIFMYILEITGILKYFWFLYRTAMPTSLIIPGVVYLYVRSVIFDEQEFQKHGWIHFIPLIIGIIQYAPYFTSSSNFKIQTVELVLSDRSHVLEIGILDEKIFSLIRIAIASIYLFLTSVILINNLRTRTQVNHSLAFQNQVKRWIHFFGFSYGLNNLAIILYFIFLISPSFSSNFPVLYENGGVLITLTFNSTLVFYSSYLLIKPEILIGMQSQKNIYSQNKKSNSDFLESQLEHDYQLIKSLIEEKKLFLNTNLKIQDIAVELNMPIRRASLVVNNCFNENFNQLINSFRIRYAIEKIEDGYLEKYTLDSLCKETGFKSRSNFYLSFKSKTGMTPKQFLEKRK